MSLVPRVPSPIRHLPALSGSGGELFIKDDGELHSLYGGNKVRKLALIFADARERGSRRIVTFGAAGSHHVLTAGLFAPAFGLRAAALLAPQPKTPHAEMVLRAILATGLDVTPIERWELAPLAFARSWQRGDYVVGPGGSGLLGTLAYAAAVEELEQQIARGLLPMPDVVVTAVGSGGTAAGLLSGIVARKLPIRVVGVQVAGGRATKALVLGLATRALVAKGISPRGLTRHFELTRAELGRGYGYASPGGLRAREAAATQNIRVEPTYTEKALAHALALTHDASRAKRQVILYWHTLSAREPPNPVEGPLAARFEALLSSMG
ncbi:MAG TPA: pyridoxal-phosphate dependent enzyme [Polyangiaceae bacterium]|nr:pyridoxal-phosphate dependent enzyme [Polyangiaceae bacterium]